MKIPKLIRSIALFVLMFISISAFSLQKEKANKDTKFWRYEIESAGIGQQGYYLVKVWSYSKNKNIAIEQVKKNAVHGVLFKGFPGKDGTPSQKPLLNNPNIEQEKADYFENFFAENGKYMKFISVTSDGYIAAEDRMRTGKEYKIGVVVSVNVSELRIELENAGILRKLGSGF